MLLAGASGLYLYQAKHRAQLLDRQIAATMHQAELARDRSGVLRAEWMQLQDPERLAALAGRFLPTLKSTQPGQFTTLAELDNRLPAVRATPTPPDTTDEPDPAPLAAAEPTPRPAPAAASAPPPAPVAPAALPPPVHVAARPSPARVAEPHAPERTTAERTTAERTLAEQLRERRASHEVASALGYARSLAAGTPPVAAPVPMVTSVSTPLLVRPAPGYTPPAYTPPSYTPPPMVGSALGMARSLPPLPRYGN
jgi:hypothetical protein